MTREAQRGFFVTALKPVPKDAFGFKVVRAADVRQSQHLFGVCLCPFAAKDFSVGEGKEVLPCAAFRPSPGNVINHAVAAVVLDVSEGLQERRGEAVKSSTHAVVQFGNAPADNECPAPARAG